MTAKGFGFGTIGGLLKISSHTVDRQAKKCYCKLSVHAHREAVGEAFQMGWL